MNKAPFVDVSNQLDRSLLVRILICIGALGIFSYGYLDTQNEVTWRRLEIPVASKEIKDLKQANTCLQYEIDLFESPEHLMELARRPEFSHLKQPFLKEIVVLQEALALQDIPAEQETKVSLSPRLRLAVGTK